MVHSKFKRILINVSRGASVIFNGFVRSANTIIGTQETRLPDGTLPSRCGKSETREFSDDRLRCIVVESSAVTVAPVR